MGFDDCNKGSRETIVKLKFLNEDFEGIFQNAFWKTKIVIILGHQKNLKEDLGTFIVLTLNKKIMGKSITAIEGIGEVFKGKLAHAGITTVEGLLEKGASKSGRKAIAVASGIEEGRILDWVNMADLFRINGIASQFAELLKAAGVDTVKELRTRNAENLHAALVKTQEEKGLTKAVPALSKIQDFIAQAKDLDPVVTH